MDQPNLLSDSKSTGPAQPPFLPRVSRGSEPAPAAGPVSPQVTAEDKRVILLAEDDPDHVLIIQNALKKAGVTCDVQVVTSGEDTMQYLRGNGKYSDRKLYPLPTLLLLDLKMPTFDGFDVICWIRKQGIGIGEIPIIVLTTSNYGSDVVRAYQSGANSFIVKPMDIDTCVLQMKALNEFWLHYCELPPPDRFRKHDDVKPGGVGPISSF